MPDTFFKAGNRYSAGKKTLPENGELLDIRNKITKGLGTTVFMIIPPQYILAGIPAPKNRFLKLNYLALIAVIFTNSCLFS
nr:hypothetical protein [uncultured Methanoregula sp.]